MNKRIITYISSFIILLICISGCSSDTASSWEKFNINQQGDTISGSEGTVSLVIPSGAVAEDLTIFIRPKVNPTADPSCVENTIYEFGPEGTKFEEPLTLTIKYDPQKLPVGVVESNLKITKLIDGSWLPFTDCSVDTTHKTVTTTITDFSTYSIKPWLEEYDATLPINLICNHDFGILDPRAFAIGLAPYDYCPVLPNGIVTFLEFCKDEFGDIVGSDDPWYASYWWRLEGDIGIIGSLHPNARYEIGEGTWLSSTNAIYFRAFSYAKEEQSGTITVRVESNNQIIGEYSTHIEILEDVRITPSSISCDAGDEVEFECRFPLNDRMKISGSDPDRIRYEWTTSGIYGYLINNRGLPQTHITRTSNDSIDFEHITYRADSNVEEEGVDDVNVEVYLENTLNRTDYLLGKKTAKIKVKASSGEKFEYILTDADYQTQYGIQMVSESVPHWDGRLLAYLNEDINPLLVIGWSYHVKTFWARPGDTITLRFTEGSVSRQNPRDVCPWFGPVWLRRNDDMFIKKVLLTDRVEFECRHKSWGEERLLLYEKTFIIPDL